MTQVFICGITGQQGSSLAHHLLSSPQASPITVHGLARDPSSPAAQALTKLGAVLFTGSYADAPVLAAALANCTALFLNPPPSWADRTAERTTGEAILAAALAVPTLQHVVYTSALTAGAPRTLPNWDEGSLVAGMLLNKHALEDTVRKAGVGWTILRPGNFMSNYTGVPALTRQKDLVQDGVSVTAFARDTRIPMVDVDTIGAFACAAVLHPEKFDEAEIDLADERLTLDETLAKIGAATGRSLVGRYMTDEEVEAQKGSNPMVSAHLAMRHIDRFFDLERVKTWGIPLSSFDEFIQREAASFKETYNLAKE